MSDPLGFDLDDIEIGGISNNQVREVIRRADRDAQRMGLGPLVYDHALEDPMHSLEGLLDEGDEW